MNLLTDEKISRPERTLRVSLDKNVMARVANRHIQHSRELKLHKKLAIKEKTISLLMDALRSAFER